jgi:hypothetical protein
MIAMWVRLLLMITVDDHRLGTATRSLIIAVDTQRRSHHGPA